MKTETRIKAQIYNFPIGLVKAIKDNPNWATVKIGHDPHPDGQSNYEIRYKEKCVLRFYVWNGYGLGSSAVYPQMGLLDYNLLKSIYGNHMNVWEVLNPKS